MTFSDSAAISIPTIGTASPYPSGIAVPSGLGLVAKLTVVLRTFSHTFPADVDVLLVGPGGQRIILMSDVGGVEAGATCLSSDSVTNLTFTFDDAGPALGSTLSSGTYRPTDRVGCGSDSFPSPAPSGPYGSTLSTFNGLDPFGIWSLFVVDDNNQDSGSVAGGWSLVISFTDTPLVPGSSAIREEHITDLRARIGTLRARFGFPAFNWTDPALAGIPVKAVHVQELRAALAPVCAAVRKVCAFTDEPIVPRTTLVKAVHIVELRSFVNDLDSAQP